MGIRVTIGGYPFQATDFNVQEDATPLAAGDSSGGVGTVSITLPPPDFDAFPYVDPSLFEHYGDGTYGDGVYGSISTDIYPTPRDTGWRRIRDFGPEFFLGAAISLTDTRKGYTLGSVNAVGRNDDGSISFTCLSRLGELNVYGIQADPFVGTLAEALEYYLSLAGISTGWFVDDTIAANPVVFPGWNGELWYRLKQIAVSQDCDLSLVSGVILLRPIRARIATRGRDISRSRTSSVQTLAQAVEVYKYNNRSITNELVYPPGGWTPDVEIFNVNAGEKTEYTIQLSSSLSSFEVPSHEMFVAESFESSSVYTVIGSDGLPVSEELWSAQGGKVEFSLNPDTTSLKLALTGAVNVPTQSGEASSQFSLALASDTTGNRYSTLRIVGSGVSFDKQKVRIRTGVPASKTSTDIGVTIDNPFISTHNDVCRAGTRAARQYAGQVPSLSGSVVAVNRRGDSGQATYPTYEEVQTTLEAELGAPTYGSVEAYYSSQGLTTYGSVRQFWFETVRDDFTNQVFGNVNGARVFDKASRRWYRIRSATLQADTISFQADDDLTHGDIEAFHADKSRTYGDVQLILGNLTYKQAELVGLYGG